MSSWRDQEHASLLQYLPDGPALEKEVEKELGKIQADLHRQILDPMQRQAVADSLEVLLQTFWPLQSRVFKQAAVALMEQQQDVLKEDDKAIQWHLENFELKGMKKFLGLPPDADAIGCAPKLFRQRLERVADEVRRHLARAKASLLVPSTFAEEMGKLKAASEDMGDFLELYQDRLVPNPQP